MNFSIGILPEDIALFHALYRTSVKGRRDLAKVLLTDPNVGIAELDDSYDNRVAEIFEVINKYLGYEIEFYDDDKVIREYNKKALCQFELNGRTYVCSSWDFFLIRRREEVKAEILKEFPVIENAELNAKIEEKLASTNYVLK